jgi:hypothetical protein
MPVKIPPNGFIGNFNQTPATQALVSRNIGGRRKGPARKRRKKTAKKKRSPARRKAASPRKRVARKKTGKRLVKGSAAAKRRMAQLRKMRRK